MMKRRLRATLFMAFALPLGISAALGFGPGVASAGLGHVCLGAHTRKDIKDHCDAAGGTSFEGSGTYGCWGPGGDVNYTDKSGTCIGTCEKCGRAAPLDSSLLDDLVGRAQVDGILQVVPVVPPQLDLADLAGTAGDPFVPPPGVDP